VPGFPIYESNAAPMAQCRSVPLRERASLRSILMNWPPASRAHETADLERAANPTGGVLSSADLQRSRGAGTAIGRSGCTRRIYSRPSTTPSSFPSRAAGMQERTIILRRPSKTYAMTGCPLTPLRRHWLIWLAQHSYLIQR